MSKKYNFDYIVIGGGPAGDTAALNLAQRTKKRVAVVEEHSFSDNYSSRDIPYAISLNFAHAFFKYSNCPETSGQELSYDFPTVVAHQNAIIGSFDAEKKKLFEKHNITRIEGHAHFLNPHTISVGKVQYSSDYFILATGSQLKTAGISGIESVNYLNPITAVRIRRLPKYVFIIGGGPTGCEIASYYAELGAKVIIMEKEARLLPREEKETSACITEFFTHKLGVLVVTNAEVVSVEEDNVSKQVIYVVDKQKKSVRIDNIILATGFEPRTDCDLEKIKIKTKPNGAIATNKFFQTSVKNIYAIGDCLGNESSTERVEYQASLLSSNLIKKSKSLPNYHGFARVTNTYPEIATVGLTEPRLIKLKRKYKKSVVYLKDLPMSKIERFPYGFVKILTDRKNHIIGATVVAPNAGAMIGELSVAIRHHLTILEITGTPHATNSYSLAVKLAAKSLVK